jgi:hypothetical protein
METSVNPQISFLDEVKIQAQVLLPVLKALRAELGKERADKLVFTALRDSLRNMWLQMGALTPGSPREKWEALSAAVMPKIGEGLRYQVPGDEYEHTGFPPMEATEYKMTRCPDADYFRSLGEPDLGAVLCCEIDDHIAEVGKPEVEFTRTQTIMKGAKYCDIRYRLKNG